MLRLPLNNIDTTLYQRCATLFQCSMLFQYCATLFQCCFINVVQHWKPDVGFCFIFNIGSALFQCWSTKLKQRWSDIEMLAELLNGRCSFIFTNLFTHTTTLTSILIHPSFSFNFHLPIPPLLVQKINLTIPTNTSLLYSSAIFCCCISVYNHPNNLYQKHFSYLHQAASRDQGAWESCKDLHCFNPSLLPESMGSNYSAHNHWFLIA